MELIIATAILATLATIFPGLIKILAWAIVFPIMFLAAGSFVWVGVNLFTDFAYMNWGSFFLISGVSGLPIGLLFAKEAGG